MLTECPKCHYSRKPIDVQINQDICPACGIVYVKWLEKAHTLARISFFIGTVLICVAILWGIFILQKKKKNLFVDEVYKL